MAAVVDWEIWHTDARAWELIRSLSFSKLLDSPHLESYLEGYGRHVRLSAAEIELALTLWFQSRLVGLLKTAPYPSRGQVCSFFHEPERLS